MSEEILDLNEFLERVQNDKDLLVELLDIFMEDYQGKRKQLQAAIENKDFEQLKGVAHSLKGASGNISAKKLRESFLQLEEMGKSGDVSDGAEVLQTIDEQYTAFTDRVATLKEEFKS